MKSKLSKNIVNNTERWIKHPLPYRSINNHGNNGRNIPLILEAKITDYINLTTSLLNAFGICFLTPIFLILLVKFGILSRQTLKKQRKYAIVLIFIISAILTPPDVLSQILLAIPLICMYELSILLSKNSK